MSMYEYIVKKLALPAGDFQELFRGSFVSLVTKVAGLGCAQLFAFVVARYLGAETWGTFSLALSVITIASIIGTLGLDVGLLKLSAETGPAANTSDLYGKSFLLTCVASGLCTLLVFYSAPFIAVDFFNKPSMTVSFKIASFAILPLSLLNVDSQTLRGLKKVTKYVFLRFIARYVFAILALILLLVVFTGENLVIFSYIISLYIVVLVSLYWLYKEGMFSTFFRTEHWFEKKDYARLLRISLPLLLASSLIFVKGWIDSIMVGIFLTKADVGVYNIALKLSGLTAIILTAVNTIAAPKFAETYNSGDKEKLNQIVQQSTRMIFYGTLPILLVFLLFPGYILQLFGSEFSAGKQALILLSIGNFVNAISGSVGYFMQMTDSQVAFQNITFISTGVGILLNYILIPVLGINGAALSTCIGLVLWNVTCVVFIQAKYGIRTYYNPFFS